MLQYLFVLLFIFFPSGVILRFNIFQGAFLTPLDIIIFLISLTIFQKTIKNKLYKNNRILLYFSLFILTGFISLFVNHLQLTQTDKLTALLYLIRYVCYSSLILAGFFINTTFRKKMEKLLIGSGIAVVFFGYVQYLFYQNLRNLYYLGWDDHLYRMFSTFLDPNFAGAFFVLYLLFLVNLIFMEKNFKLHRVKLIILLLFSFITGLAILLTHSRSAIIMLIAVFLVFFISKKLFKLAALSFAVIIILFFIFSNRAVENLNPFRIASSEARITSAIDALSIIEKSPIYGVGFNAYRYAQMEYGIRNGLGARISHADASTDNSFLFVLATTGIVGFFFYLAFYFEIIKSLKKGKNLYKFMMLSMIVGVFINSFFINTLFYVPILIWINGTVGIFGIEKFRDYR